MQKPRKILFRNLQPGSAICLFYYLTFEYEGCQMTLRSGVCEPFITEPWVAASWVVVPHPS